MSTGNTIPISDFVYCASVVLGALTDPSINIDPCLCDNWAIKQLPTYAQSYNKCRNVNYAISANDACANVVSNVLGGVDYVKYFVCKFSISQCSDTPYAAIGFITLAISLISSAILRQKANDITGKEIHNKLVKGIIFLLLLMTTAISAASNITSKRTEDGEKVYCKSLNIQYINIASIISNILISLSATYVAFNKPKIRWYFVNLCLISADLISCALNLYAYVITPGLQGEISFNGNFGIICLATWASLSLVILITSIYLNTKEYNKGHKYAKTWQIIITNLLSQLRIPQLLVLITMTEASVTNKAALYIGPYLTKSGTLLNVGKIISIIASLTAALLMRLNKKQAIQSEGADYHLTYTTPNERPDIQRNNSSFWKTN